MSATYLKEILDLSKSEKNLLFVFDIDSTLYNVSPRNQEIVKDFARKSNLDPELKQSLQTFTTHAYDWGVKQALLRLNLKHLQEDVIQAVKSHWNTHFFSGDFLHFDQTYPGATEFVNLVNKNAPVYYLTGRDVHRMGEATLVQLSQSGFPTHPTHNKIILKPNKNFLDHTYKIDELKKLSQKFSKIYFFENEPVILNEVKKDLAQSVTPICVDSVHSGRAKKHDDIITIKPDYRLL